MANAIATTQNNVCVSLSTIDGFEAIQRIARMFASSDLVPDTFKKNIANCSIAIEVAARMGISPFTLMQHMYVVHGKPALEAKLLIACVNSTGKYTSLRYEYTGDGDARTCVAWAKELSTGEILRGTPISIAMAKAEGWYGKKGSKWPTMPEQMLAYRSASFWQNMYCPEVRMGMQTVDEVIDVGNISTIDDVDYVSGAADALEKKLLEETSVESKTIDIPTNTDAVEEPQQVDPQEADQQQEHEYTDDDARVEIQATLMRLCSNNPVKMCEKLTYLCNVGRVEDIPADRLSAVLEALTA